MWLFLVGDKTFANAPRTNLQFFIIVRPESLNVHFPSNQMVIYGGGSLFWNLNIESLANKQHFPPAIECKDNLHWRKGVILELAGNYF